MTMQLIRKPAFADSDGETKTLHYTVTGTISEDVARNFFLLSTDNYIATSWGTLYREKPVIHQFANDMFDVDVTYTRRNREVGQWNMDFDTSGGTVVITHSKESIKRYSSSTSELGSAAATAVPKYFNAIGVDRTGEPKGTEKIIPALKFNVQFNHGLGVVTPNYMKYLHNKTGLVNSAPFFQFAAGEVLFLGARGSDGSQADAALSYSFAASPNATGLTIGAVAGVDKKGWEYLWITFKDAASAGGKSTQPEFVYVERVYDTDNLAASLGFG